MDRVDIGQIHLYRIVKFFTDAERWSRRGGAEDAIDLDDLQDPAVHFSGTAREAALRYPKNANVAATVALAGPGLDETDVELVADPTITENIHEVEVEGAFGRMQFRIEGRPLPGSPKSSALTAMSIVAAVRNRVALFTR